MATYYVSPAGSDSNNGTSPSTPWETVGKVNDTVLNPGDTVLFQGGQTFSGTLLYLQYGGTAADPVTIGSYGSGNATISNGTNDAIYAYNAGGIVIENLDVTGISGSTSYSGIQFYADGSGQLPAISVTGCDVTGWEYGILAGGQDTADGWNGITLSGNTTSSNIIAGILVYGTGFSADAPSYNHSNVTVSNCTADSNTGSAAITTQWSGSGIVLGNVQAATISGCVAHSNGADNNYSSGPVGIWCYASDSVTITGCVSYSNSTGTTADGDGFDLDVDCTNCTIEYCIAYSNAGAGILCFGGSADSYWGTTGSNTVRYSMCWGNGTNGASNSNFYGDLTLDGNIYGLQAYGNTLVAQDTGDATPPALAVQTPNLGATYLRNSIFYQGGTGNVLYASAGYPTLLLQGNCYYSAGTFEIDWGTSYPSLAAWRTATTQETLGGGVTGFEVSPGLSAPGTTPAVTSPSDLSPADGLQLTASSPMQGAGLDLAALFGLDYGTQDFFGNTLELPLWAGAYEGAGTGPPVILQYVTGGSASDYGLSSVPIQTSRGSGIVLFAGWDLHNSPTSGPVPVLYPADSAGNLWVHLGTSGAGGYGSRSCIWAAANTRAVEWISASLTAYANSLAYLIIEVANFPQLADLDVEDDAFLNAGVPTIELISATGSGSWRAQTGVSTVNAQCWAAGGGGQGGNQPDVGGSGGGGGEFAQEATLAVSAGTSYAYSVGAAGGGGNAGGSNGGTGGNTTFHGASVTVTAHGGGGGHNTGGGSGGSGSSNTVHYDGGGGGGQSSAFHGCGGGGSGGTGSAGEPVGSDVIQGALPVTGGGPGGPGGASVSPYYGYRPGNPPGGGGGGGGANNKNQGAGGHGADGQILLTYSVTGPESLELNATTTMADLGFTVFTVGAASGTLSAAPSSPWTGLGTISSGGVTDGVTIFPYWAGSVASTTTLNPSWTVTASASISGVLATVEASPALPTLSNPNFPNVYVQIAEGFQPGDPTAIPPVWTDISDRCMGKDGDSFITVTYGQEYELSTPEAGELVVGVNNLDGAFTPGAPSPYTIALGMPVRVLAFWDGALYQIGYGYMERTPVEFPDLPQWGLSKLTATDSIAVLNSATMPSALQGDILADGPYTYLTCGEQYLSYVNGLTSTSDTLSSYAYAEAAGLIAANSARLNQRPGMYCDSTGPVLGPGGSSPAPAETGDALNLFGDQGTGMGTGAISGSVSYSKPAAGPGVIYSDPSMPGPLNADGVTAEFWFVYSVAETSGQGVTLFQAYGSASSYWPTATFSPTGTGPASFSVRILSTSNEIQLGLNGTSVNAGVFVPSAAPQQLVIVFPVSGGTDLQVYLNGALLDTVTLSDGETTAWQALGLGPVNYAYSASPLIQDYVLGHFALFPYALSAGRIASHYATGANGASGSTVSQGAAQVLSWGYLGLPRGGPAGFGPAGSQVSDGIAMGPFYNLEGSSAADGLNGVILSDGGMMYAAPSGVLTILPRWALFNISPSVVFGDAIDGSQVPYEMGQAYDFDNTYLYNIVSVTRDDGPTTSITATVKSEASQLAYFTRSALQETISTTSDLDAYTLANWQEAVYAQPQLRVRQMSVDAAGKPGLTFPEILIATVSTVATVDRDPAGGYPVSGGYLIQKVSHAIGPTAWVAGYQLSPYVIQSAVLTLDTSGYNALGSNTLS